MILMMVLQLNLVKFSSRILHYAMRPQLGLPKWVPNSLIYRGLHRVLKSLHRV